jgi:hypothetical protein
MAGSALGAQYHLKDDSLPWGFYHLTDDIRGYVRTRVSRKRPVHMGTICVE